MYGISYNFKSMRDYPDGHKLLSVVSSVHHHGVGETLDDRALRLAESLDCITTGGMRGVYWRADLDVISVAE